ncbi:MAG TPA: hypothetical protein VF752_02840 [Thermoleophilaceae bacterium]
MATIEQGNGFTPSVEAPQKRTVALELSVPEAEALRAWLLTATNDGKTALDDSMVKAATMKLGASIDLISAVVKVREELEGAGFDTADMTDEEVEALGRKISETSLHRLT